MNLVGTSEPAGGEREGHREKVRSEGICDVDMQDECVENHPILLCAAST